MGDDHRADRLLGATGASHIHHEPAGHLGLPDLRPQHYLVHIDEVLAEAFQIDLAPVRRAPPTSGPWCRWCAGPGRPAARSGPAASLAGRLPLDLAASIGHS